MTDYTPETLRACFAEETFLVLEPGTMTLTTASSAAGRFADAWEAREREIEDAVQRAANAATDAIRELAETKRRLEAARDLLVDAIEHYPEDVFPVASDTLDARSGTFARNLLRSILKDFDALAAREEPSDYAEDQGRQVPDEVNDGAFGG